MLLKHNLNTNLLGSQNLDPQILVSYLQNGEHLRDFEINPPKFTRFQKGVSLSGDLLAYEDEEAEVLTGHLGGVVQEELDFFFGSSMTSFSSVLGGSSHVVSGS